MIAAGYLLVVRPARSRQAQQRALRAGIAPGARVMTTSGLLGRVTALDDDEVELEIADGVRVRFVAAAVGRVVAEPDESEPGVQAADGDSVSALEGDTPAA